MSVITDKIKEIQKQKNLSLRKLAKLADYPHGPLGTMINAKAPFPEPLVKKLLPLLGVTRKDFESWLLADKYPKEVLKRAIEEKKASPGKQKPILTTKIDAILQEKGMSRTDLSKLVERSQSGFNSVVAGKVGMSKPLMEKVAAALEIPCEEILSWIAADRYKLRALERALLVAE